MTHSLTHDALLRLNAAHKLPLLAALAVRFANVVVSWETRRRTRLQLKNLDDHLLRDIGLSRAEARIESSRKFWQL